MFKTGRKHPTWHVKPNAHKTGPFVQALEADKCSTAGPCEASVYAENWTQHLDTRAYEIEAERKRAMGIIFAIRNMTR